MNRFFLSIILLVVISGCAGGLNSSGSLNTGIIYGDYHVFALTAPSDWVIDNKSGVEQGLHAVFYPEDLTWKSSPATVYARATVKDDVISNAEEHVAFTLQQFHNNNSPNTKANYLENLTTRDGSIAKIYFYHGDQWGNYEVVAYIEESKTIPIVVLTARNKEALDSALQPFYDIVGSYKFYGEDANTLDQNAFESSPTEEEPQSEVSIEFNIESDSNSVRTDGDAVAALGVLATEMFNYHEQRRAVSIPDEATYSKIDIRVNSTGDIYSIVPSKDSTCDEMYQNRIFDVLKKCHFNEVSKESKDSKFRIVVTFK